MSEDWVEIDEFSDVISSLRALELSLDQFRSDNAFWKWIILATHSALQGACVCFLTGTDGSGALTKESQKALREYHEQVTQKAICEKKGEKWALGEPEYPSTRVASLHELLRRLPDDIRVELPRDFSCDPGGQIFALLKLHTLRNEYTHFPSVSHTIEVSGGPGIIGAALGIVRNIVERNDWRGVNRFEKTDVLQVVARIEAMLGTFNKNRGGDQS